LIGCRYSIGFWMRHWFKRILNHPSLSNDYDARWRPGCGDLRILE
jgi:hypothetical protein